MSITTFYYKDLAIDILSGTFIFKNHRISLTKTETGILFLLLNARIHIVTREEIMIALRMEKVKDRTIDAHVSYLRKKLPDSISEKIKAVRGGYVYEH